MSAMLKPNDNTVFANKSPGRRARGIGHTTKVYFILCQATGRVKCGIATDTRARLAGLQVGSPTPLELIAEINGDGSKERLIHRRLAQWHIHGEWFQYVPEVCDIIVDEIASHLKDLYVGNCLVLAISPKPVLDQTRPVNQRLQRFLSDYTVSSPGDRVQSSKLYQAFEVWCRALGATACTQRSFSLAMADAGYRRMHSNVVFFLDISLKQQAA